jgi:TonB family protein
MTKLSWAALPLLTMLVAPVATLQARQPAPEITVTAPSATELQAWSSRVGGAIEREMRLPKRLGTADYEQGMVDVTFLCSEDGTPTKVALARTSGSSRLDRAGLKAVERVGTLHPLPAGIGQDQVYRARMLFAIDDGTPPWRQKSASMRDEANAANSKLARTGGVITAARVTLVPAGMP